MRRPTIRLIGLLGGTLLALVLAASVAGYAGQVAATVQVSSPSGPQACNSPVTVTALIQDASGAPIADQPVAWSFFSGNVSGDSILTTSTTTNAGGIATTRVQLACATHTVVVGAVADATSGTTTIVGSGEALPRTDAASRSNLPTMALAALAVLVGMGIVLRRFTTARR